MSLSDPEMAQPLFLIVGVAVIAAALSWISGWRANIRKARKTGFRCIVVPIDNITVAFHPYNRLQQITLKFYAPLVRLLPRSWWEEWLPIMSPDWTFESEGAFFDYLGTDSFVLASPGRTSFHTARAEVIHQITSQRDKFPKDISTYGMLTIFGDNVVTTEGAHWRMHRKVTSASFNEKNAAHMFSETITQARGLLDTCLAGDKIRSRTVTTLDHHTMRLALNIIANAGFGLRLHWPGQKPPEDMDRILLQYSSDEPPDGYTMTFKDALATVLDKILTIMLLPGPLLRWLPFRYTKLAYEAKVNYCQYMHHLLRHKIAQTRSDKREIQGMDIMGQLVRAKYDREAAGENSELTDAHIVGNAFIMTVAGHETTSNTLHYTIIELATNPSTQRKLQADLDALFGDREPAEWEYEQCINAMMGSHLGACVNETLRLISPVVEIPKMVSPGSDQVVVCDGEQHVLGSGMVVTLLATSVQRSARYWPTRPSLITGKPKDLDDYLPERWYRSSSKQTDQDVGLSDAEDLGGFGGCDTSESLFRPVRGSFIPFSDGARSCLGRRLAQVEMVAALATVFQRYSIELAVNEWASDEDVDKMGEAERRATYSKAQAKSRETLRKLSSVITLKLRDGNHVPVRFVRRGHETFVHDEAL